MAKNDRTQTTGIASPVNTKLGGYFRLEQGDGRSNWTLASTATDYDRAKTAAETLAVNSGKPVRIIPVDMNGNLRPETDVVSRGRG